jgi:hypothetical protein
MWRAGAREYAFQGRVQGQEISFLLEQVPGPIRQEPIAIFKEGEVNKEAMWERSAAKGYNNFSRDKNRVYQ